jgi:hypothetical protein
MTVSKLIRVAATAAGLLAFGPPPAQIFFNDRVVIEFARGKMPAEMSWTKQMEVTERGLATLQPWAPNTSRDFWFRSQPIPAGPSWRPPTNLGLKITLDGVETAESTMKPHTRAFARYSTDRVHWSSWFPLSPAGGSAFSATSFEGTLGMPHYVREEFEELRSKWWQTNPAWSSDDHEFCLWLAAHHRSFFDSDIPFMGYVQLLVEGGAQGLRLSGMTVSLSAGMSGLQSIPRGPQRSTAEDKWFFSLEKAPAR